MKTKYAEPNTTSADKIAAKVAGMSQSQLKLALLSLRRRLRPNLTEQALESLSSDRLRHMLSNAILKSR